MKSEHAPAVSANNMPFPVRPLRRWEFVLDVLIAGGFIMDVMDHWRELGRWQWLFHLVLIAVGLWIAFRGPVDFGQTEGSAP